MSNSYSARSFKTRSASIATGWQLWNLQNYQERNDTYQLEHTICMYRIIPRLRPLPLLSEKSCSSNNEVMPILLVSSCQKKKVICKRLVREEARLLVSPIIETTTV